MAGQCVAQKFRTKFAYTKSSLSVFAMHMARSVKKIQSIIRNVDCVVEVHDARIPISGRNERFEETVALRPRLLLLNKVDLIEPVYKDQIVDNIKKKDPNIQRIMYSCCKSDVDTTVRKELLPSIIDTVKSSDRYHRSETLDYSVLIIGIPNVGKSTLINSLRNIHLKKGGRATPVGARPGITKSVMERIKVSEQPKIYVLDTPGILPPSVNSIEAAYKLALCDTIKEEVLGSIEMADYLLFYLNKHQHFSYADIYNLKHPIDDIYTLLALIATDNNLILKTKSLEGGYTIKPNYSLASSIFIKDFRQGKLGKIMLDADLLFGDAN